MHMVFGRRAFFGYAVRPSGETYWFSNYAQKEEPARDTFTDVHADTMRDRLLALHRDDPPEVSRILRALSGPIGAYPIYDMPPLPAWHRGAVCLIGDAAHAIGPHVGQGVSLALEDAFIAASVPPRSSTTRRRRSRRSSDCGAAASSRSSASRAAPASRKRRPAGWAERSAISCCRCSSAGS